MEIFNLGNDNSITDQQDDNNEIQDQESIIQPQGTTASPNPFTSSTQLPSLADLPTTTPPPSPGLNDSPRFVPGTRIECGSSKIPQARIVGGNNTYEGQYPWMAAIYLHGNGRSEFWCGGALVSPTHVVTAAHCTLDSKKRPFRPTQFTVRVGEWDLKDQDTYSQEFRVIKVTAYPEFRPNGFYNDVAVFKLDQPASFNE